MSQTHWLNFDRQHLWHPYTSMTDPQPVFPVVSASGVRLKLEDGRELIDGMASWWSAIHGYNHPQLNAALKDQIGQMSHVMFGGLTHPAAVRLGRKLVELTPEPLQHVFFSDSGSVAVEVAMKMAIQFCYSTGRPEKRRLLTIRNGYHGDTFGAMSVCDPETGMHQIWSGLLQQQLFAPAPQCRFDDEWAAQDIVELTRLIETQH
ncbi:MAG: aminotransferase class III-fold pyridoxal phosphate-dependent enzyme, partial [Geopsychrobacter sp.]|nr:aminotransferase class III-fold pyridoxal phosphate-dependent enzyme [Geopsychrobacter sp.]